MKKVTHPPADRWMIPGPCEFIPPIQVVVLETRQAIPLAENEGVYVKDCKSGEVLGGKSIDHFVLGGGCRSWGLPLHLPIDASFCQRGYSHKGHRIEK